MARGKKTKYIFKDGGGGEGTVELAAGEDPYQAWIEWMEAGMWPQVKTTEWIHGSVVDEQGNVEHYTFALHPEVPPCREDDIEHEWCSPLSVVGGLKENPGVWGHGAGVIIKEICAHCGVYRIIDTWAQDRSTGEQGLTSVEYWEPDPASLAFVESREANKE